ncbi:ATP-dependent nuclease [Tumebacillus permanentifrigoris]|uniref:AAA domain-containing protein n=1 Tax=Tumebacillus permanentifrigoris TaxID=378543 RepID=A0A316DBZ0_9BACL|nr:AAA family ATPase [Tumebacillus permanentifrigoris]PWK14807.1 AAA domain-containing protein [Tumebacillus permanentifrigoris]
MKLSMEIDNIKSIKKLVFELPVEKGLYAITGQNGSGKSTIVACAATVFFNMPLKDVFGKTINGASIKFNLNGASRKLEYNGRWSRTSNGYMKIKGFYEGSIIFGNRFRDTTFSSLKKLDRVNLSHLEVGDEFIRKNLGGILHNNQNYYDKMFKVQKEKARNDYDFNGEPYLYEKNGKLVSQLHMSTGENLLISILHSLNLRISERSDLSTPCLLFLDEVELALHPSSLTRLVNFLNVISNDYNLAIYFSTHSIELIKDIKPDNIFFVERHVDDTIEIINPCYPSYATRILYDHTGYDYIILVEDDLAKEIITKLLRKYRLLNNKLVHVLPCGGWSNVIKLAQEVISSNLVSKPSSFLLILDGDVKASVDKFIRDHDIDISIPLNYLPIESLEKYLKTNLYQNVDHALFRILNDYIFHKISLTQLVDNYRNSDSSKNDTNGKNFYKQIESELRNRNKNRTELVEMVVEYLMENDEQKINKVVNFLSKQLS